jgi:hypothetical protein
MDRPLPPSELTEGALAGRFVPAPDLLDWINAVFIEETGALFNEDHAHLIAANIGCLWTNVINTRHGKRVVGQCEFRPPGGSMGKWQRARAQCQLHDWFQRELDFLLTFDAQYAAQAGDAEFCALVEHELYHCGQQIDEFGQPKFTDDGMPVFRMRGHDVEEFVGVVRRYGAVSIDVALFLDATREAPTIEADAIGGVCGTCKA